MVKTSKRGRQVLDRILNTHAHAIKVVKFIRFLRQFGALSKDKISQVDHWFHKS